MEMDRSINILLKKPQNIYFPGTQTNLYLLLFQAKIVFFNYYGLLLRPHPNIISLLCSQV